MRQSNPDIEVNDEEDDGLTLDEKINRYKEETKDIIAIKGFICKLE